MKHLKNMSIQKRLSIVMLAISAFIILVITLTAMVNTYETMREQLIYNRRMSIGWLRDRLELELADYQERFYEFEVNKDYKNSIEKWCVQGEELDYDSRWQLITAMNELISMDSNLNSMEIYNLKGGKVLVAERSGASLLDTVELPIQWDERQADLQSNLVFLRTEKEILILHQMHRFLDKEPYALIVMHVRPYALQDILRDIKMTSDETVLVLNDENQMIEADYGELLPEDLETAQKVAQKMSETDKTEFILNGNFWFYREVASAKLKVLLSVPNHVIIDSLKGTLMIAGVVGLITFLLSVAGAIFFPEYFQIRLFNYLPKCVILH